MNIHETDAPTEADKRFDAYIRSILINTNKKIAERLNPIKSKEVSYDEMIEERRYSREYSYEDEYDFEKSLPSIIFENGRQYRIDSPDLYDALQSLKPTERKTILMKFLNGYSDNEISEVLNVPRTTIQARRIRIIGKIKTFLLKRRNRYGQETENIYNGRMQKKSEKR